MTSKGSRIAASFLFASAVAASGPAQAQSEEEEDTTKLAEEILNCAGLPHEDDRLECYDALAAPLLGLEKPSEASEGGALHSFTGTDDWDSEVVEVDRPWRLVWQNKGSLLTVELWTPQEEMLDVIGNQIGQGGGRSEVQEPGSYRLAVRGLGGWNIKVVGAEPE